jgi:hypothetical protein
MEVEEMRRKLGPAREAHIREIEEKVETNQKLHSQILDALDDQRLAEEARYRKEMKQIQDRCYRTTGHEDDGSMFHGFCKFCREILE